MRKIITLNTSLNHFQKYMEQNYSLYTKTRQIRQVHNKFNTAWCIQLLLLRYHCHLFDHISICIFWNLFWECLYCLYIVLHATYCFGWYMYNMPFLTQLTLLHGRAFQLLHINLSTEIIHLCLINKLLSRCFSFGN